MQLQIEKNVPIPAPAKKRGEIDALVAKMEVGDSVLTSYTPSGATSVFTLASRRNGTRYRFNARREGDGARVWRVA